MPSARRVSLGALIAVSLFLLGLSFARSGLTAWLLKNTDVKKEFDDLATGAMIILVYSILPLIILFSPLILVFLIIVVYRHCRHRKKRINYNPIAMITAEERKERAKQYMAQFNPSQARPVVEAAPVAKMV